MMMFEVEICCLCSKGIRNLVILLSLSCLIGGLPASFRENSGVKIWSPPDGITREQWNRCWGLPCGAWRKTAQILSQLESGVGSQGTSEEMERDSLNMDDGNVEIQDVLLTPEQAAAFLPHLESTDRQNVDGGAAGHADGTLSGVKSLFRSKRKIHRDVNLLWSLPIPFKFDGSHSDSQRSIIKSAFKQWEDQTCVRFQEFNQDVNLIQSHLILTKSNPVCASFVGRIKLSPGQPQMFNLADSCFTKVGVALHEVGHAIGLYHEHQRIDRNDHVDIAFEKIGEWAISNFKIPRSDSVIDHGVPYDVNSVMHYSGNIGSSDPEVITIRTKDPLLQMNIGQRDSISFLDAKVVNLAYCKDKCSGSVESVKCQNGGYLNPNDCSRCLCPDGLSGQLCDQPAPSIGEKCSEEISLEKDQAVFVNSPGYNEGKTYKSGIKCNYLIKCQDGALNLNFVEKFSVDSSILTCQNWVEVKYKKDFSLPGPRFCGKSLPKFDVKSESNQAIIMFRSLTEKTSASEDQIGFKLRIQCGGN